MKTRNWKQKIAYFFLSVISIYAILSKEELFRTSVEYASYMEKGLQLVANMLQSSTILTAFAAIFVFCLFNRVLFTNQRGAGFSVSALITAGFFSLFRVVGISISIDGSLNYLIQGNAQRLNAIVVFTGYWALFYAIVKFLFNELDTIRIKDMWGNNRLISFLDRHIFAAAFLSILVCWGAFWILYFPGSLPHDGQVQLEMFFGVRPLSQHHPLLSTLVMGGIVWLGKTIHSYQTGIAFYVVFQSLICAAIYAAVCRYLHSKRAPIPMVIGSIVFYAVVPLFASYAQAVMKDTLFYGFFTWFALEYVRFYLNDGGKGALRQMLLAGILCILYRKDAFYAVAISLAVLVLVSKGFRRGGSYVLVVVCCVHFLTGVLFTDILGIREGKISEALSVPFQQTARYVKYHEDEVTEDQKQIINSVLSYSTIIEKYNPGLSDPVKATWKNPSREDLTRYIGVWWEMFLKHPRTYIEATLNNMYGYIDAFSRRVVMLQHQLYNKGPLGGTTEEIVFNTYVSTDSMRNIGLLYTKIWDRLPILSMFCFCGVYTWIEIFLAVNLLRRRRGRDAALFVLPLMILLISCLSPVNNLCRYMMPIIASVPIFLWFSVGKQVETRQKTT